MVAAAATVHQSSRVGAIAAVCAILAGLATALTVAEGLAWWIDLFVHFRVHYAVTLLLSAAVMCKVRKWSGAIACVLLATFNLAPLPAYWWPPAAATDGPSLHVVTFNVRTDNRDYTTTLDYLRQLDADLIALVEVDSGWLTALTPLARTHPFVQTSIDGRREGVALFSRLPLANSATHTIAGADFSELTTDVSFANSVIHLVVTHPPPPVSAASAALRDDYLHALAGRLAALPGALLILGDLNITPWAKSMRTLLEHGSVKECARGHGLAPSWPAALPVGRIPIDYCLYRQPLAVTAHAAGPPLGSDHLPISARLVFQTMK